MQNGTTLSVQILRNTTVVFEGIGTPGPFVIDNITRKAVRVVMVSGQDPITFDGVYVYEDNVLIGVHQFELSRFKPDWKMEVHVDYDFDEALRMWFEESDGNDSPPVLR